MKDLLKSIVEEHNTAVSKFFETHADYIEWSVDEICKSISNGGKVIVFGNGGSATDASHFVAELVGRYEKERKGLPAISLSVDPAVVTAISNDYGYENVFSRQIEALAKNGDVLIGISTSGSSKNVLNAFKASEEGDVGTFNIMITSERFNSAENKYHDISFQVPSKKTYVIQEVHIMLLHVLAKLVEEKFHDSNR